MNASSRSTNLLRMLCGGALLLCGAALAQAPQPFPVPGKPIRIIVPAPPGGPADIMARVLAARAGAELGDATVVVENRPGGASVPAALAVARASPDGHTLMLTINTTHTQVPHMFAKPPYDPFKEFTMVTQLYRAGTVLVAHPSVAARDLRELVEESKAQGPLPAASSSPGTDGHLFLEILRSQYGAQLEHVPYKGAAPAVQDLVAGFVKVLFVSPVSAVPHIRAGRLKSLAVTGKSRIVSVPEVKTATELGFPALEITGWLGIFAPAGLPSEVLAKLNAALVAGIRHPEVRAKFEPLGLEITGTSAAEFDAIVRRDNEFWGRIIRAAGVRLD